MKKRFVIYILPVILLFNTTAFAQKSKTADVPKKEVAIRTQSAEVEKIKTIAQYVFDKTNI